MREIKFRGKRIDNNERKYHHYNSEIIGNIFDNRQ